ncbi:MAG: bifunctional ADP-dependent NAD(P)H-hydrate dehydratase/NAD(P)H-hydrate epimerase [Acidimicrobiales bacterium]
MEPVVTPAEMGVIDAAAPEPVEVLIERAGWAVARSALGLLGRTYGARVLVLAGKGNNGNDGRVAARFLAARGVRCRVEAADFQPSPSDLARCDLVIDAAYGTGFRGSWDAPDVGSTPVLAVDIPSGVNGLTGEAAGRVLPAAATVTFAAWKPGLLFHPGRGLAGSVTVADIGLDARTGCRAWHLSATDLAPPPSPSPSPPPSPSPSPPEIRSLSGAERHFGSSESPVGPDGWPQAGAEAHKWQRAVWVIGGHGTMLGAPSLAAAAAGRAGAGYVALSVPGATLSGPPVPVESVIRPLPARWGTDVVAEQARFAALVVGPGLPVDLATQGDVLNVAANTSTRGLVLDGGALDAIASDPSILRGRAVPAVLTPHEGELRRLLRGRAPGADRIDTVRRLAADLGAVVLAKGPTTVAAHPDGRVLVSTAGDQRLASAGTGDVLAGLVGAGLAGGLDPLAAAGLAAELHGRAARLGLHRGFVAGDLPLLVGQWLETAALGSSPSEPDR